MNLIICCTPLQVLIAEKIIAKFPHTSFYGVMLSTVSNKKFDFLCKAACATVPRFFFHGAA